MNLISKLRPRLHHALLCAMALLSATASAQTTRNVGPGQPYATIQSGIDAAVNGDTVLVAPGTYHEHIDFKGKAITVTSSGGAINTIITGDNQDGIATVAIHSGETSRSILSNLLIEGGGETTFTGKSDGGVYIAGASPVIRDNIITANYCHNIDVFNGSAAIQNNVITGVLRDRTGICGAKLLRIPQRNSFSGCMDKFAADRHRQHH